MGQSQRIPYLKPYMWGVALVGVVIVAVAGVYGVDWRSLDRTAYINLALFATFVFASCFKPVDIPETSLSMTMTMPLAFSLYLVHDVGICILFASVPFLLAFLCTEWKLGPERLSRAALYNTAGFTLSIAFACGAYSLAGGALLSDGITDGFRLLSIDGIGIVLRLALWICVYNFVNITLCAICYSLYDPRPFRVLLFDSLRGWSFPNLLFGVPVSLLFATLYHSYGSVGILILILPWIAGGKAIRVRAEQLEAYYDTISTLGSYMQHYHPYTKGHLERVADLSDKVARQIGLPLQSLSLIRDAGRLHDIGKVGVSEEVLDKVGKLSEEDWDVIRQHPARGAEIISGLKFLERIVPWVRAHHERPDGRGYPDHLQTGQIPIEAAVIAVADAFDAMTGGPDERDRRTYRPPLTVDQAMDQIRYGAGTQFDARVVRAFIRVMASEEHGHD